MSNKLEQEVEVLWHMINKDNELHDWLFHYNPYVKHWAAFKREDSSDYFNGKLEKVLISKKQNILVEIILKSEGDPIKIKKLING